MINNERHHCTYCENYYYMFSDRFFINYHDEQYKEGCYVCNSEIAAKIENCHFDSKKFDVSVPLKKHNGTTEYILAKKRLTSVKQLFEKHLGKPVILVGSGPSMTDNIARQLRRSNILTIGVNQCYMYDDCSYFPDYHIHTDYETDFYLSNNDIFAKMGQTETIILAPSKTKEKLLRTTNALTFQLDEGYGFRMNDLQDPSKEVYFSKGYSAIFAALQLAVYMGCNPICLIGVDMKPSKGGYLHNFDNRKMRPEEKGRWERIAFPCKINHIETVASPALDAAGKTVLNLSKQSKLECFLKPDMSLEGVIRWLSPDTTGRQQVEPQQAIQA